MSWEQSLSTYYVPGLLLASVLVFPWLDPTPLSSPGPAWLGLHHAVCPLGHELPKDKACVCLAPQAFPVPTRAWHGRGSTFDSGMPSVETGPSRPLDRVWSPLGKEAFLVLWSTTELSGYPLTAHLPESAAPPLSSPALPDPRHTGL